MQLLSIIIIGVVLGVASCDIDCFNKETIKCRPDFGKDARTSILEYCRTHVPFVKCIRDSCAKCKVGFLPEAERWWAAIKDACTDGTALNKNLDSNIACITSAIADADCTTDSDQDLKDMPDDQAMCKEFDSLRDCLYQRIESACSRNVADDFLTIYGAMVDYQLKICDEVILKQK
ncbi:uncharacterized protein CEXT_518791 [Caerostris extrusa]|uniref:Uncharacterized protein n=1 Tax=Caerostris extrusa TaxID=172846 RepID=A0AAV4P679_CAEEX|nr:uncharacterized protein CEXT_518791 [Caerostris extrusa]